MRLSPLLSEMVHKDQRGFVKGQNIGDNIMEVYSLIMQAENGGGSRSSNFIGHRKSF